MANQNCVIQVAAAKFKKGKQFPEASRHTAVIIAPTREYRLPRETAVAAIRTAENSSNTFLTIMIETDELISASIVGVPAQRVKQSQDQIRSKLER